MYMYMYVYTLIACTHARTHASTHARKHTRTHAHTHTRTHARTHSRKRKQNVELSALYETVIFPRAVKLWSFGVTHETYKRFLTGSTGSTWVGKQGGDNVDMVHVHLF